MERASLYPVRFEPVYKDYLWGGTRIAEIYGRPETPTPCAESWEVSDRNDGMSIVADGPLRGRSLRELIEANPRAWLGADATAGRFPLLVKLIDARDRLSVQVHPDERAAAEIPGAEPKTEAWVFLGDRPAEIHAGLLPGTTPERLADAVRDGTCERLLRRREVHPGDVAFVPAGRLHAIGAGCLLLEVQQNSNTTYRLYDWHRVGPDGHPRELHVERALRAIRFDDDAPPPPPPKRLEKTAAFLRERLLECPYFRIDRIALTGRFETRLDGRAFHILFVAEGNATLRWPEGETSLSAGSTRLVPAALPSYALDGRAEILRIEPTEPDA